MAKQQWYVKSKGYKEIFDSVKLANTKFNKLKRELEEEEEGGYVQMWYRPEGGEYEIFKEISFDED